MLQLAGVCLPLTCECIGACRVCAETAESAVHGVPLVSPLPGPSAGLLPLCHSTFFCGVKCSDDSKWLGRVGALLEGLEGFPFVTRGVGQVINQLTQEVAWEHMFTSRNIYGDMRGMMQDPITGK